MDLPTQFAREAHAQERGLGPGDPSFGRTQPRPGQVGIGEGGEQRARFRPGHDQAVQIVRPVLQFYPLGQPRAQHIGIVALGHGGGDAADHFVALDHHRHLGEDPAAVVGKVAQAHPPRRRQARGGQPVEMRPRAGPHQPEAGKAG